jgi:hypothetical protein
LFPPNVGVSVPPVLVRVKIWTILKIRIINTVSANQNNMVCAQRAAEIFPEKSLIPSQIKATPETSARIGKIMPNLIRKAIIKDGPSGDSEMEVSKDKRIAGSVAIDNAIQTITPIPRMIKSMPNIILGKLVEPLSFKGESIFVSCVMDIFLIIDGLG